MVLRPNLFIIGVRKGGTTALYDMLGQHPDIAMSKIKEPGFFNDPKNLDGYLKLFPRKRVKYYGEASTSYSRNPETARRIKQFNPESKIILVLREPISQMMSSESQTGYERPGSKSVASIEERALRHRRYLVYVKKTIEEFHSHFGRQFLVVLFEDFRKDNLAVYRRLLRFLELEDFVPQTQELNVNKTVKLCFLPFKRIIDGLKLSVIAAKLLGPRWFQKAGSVYQNLIARKTRPFTGAYTRTALQRHFKPVVEDMDKLLQEKDLLECSLVKEWRY